MLHAFHIIVDLRAPFLSEPSQRRRLTST